MRWLRWAVLYAVSLAGDLLIGWPAVLLAHWLGGVPGRLRWEWPAGGPGLPCFSADLQRSSGVYRLLARLSPARALAGLTLGHAVLYVEGAAAPVGPWTETQRHEHRHVEWFEVIMLTAAVVAVMGLAGGLRGSVALLLWASAWPVSILAGTVVALLRGEKGYPGSAHEEAAGQH